MYNVVRLKMQSGRKPRLNFVDGIFFLESAIILKLDGNLSIEYIPIRITVSVPISFNSQVFRQHAQLENSQSMTLAERSSIESNCVSNSTIFGRRPTIWAPYAPACES